MSSGPCEHSQVQPAPHAASTHKHRDLKSGGSTEHFKQSGDFNKEAACLYGLLQLLIIAAPINALVFIRSPLSGDVLGVN